MISLSIAILLLGGFFDWGIAAVGISIAAEIMWLYHKKRPIYCRKHKYDIWIPGVIFLWMILVSFWAIDGGANLFGVLRGSVVLLWMYLCFQLENDEKKRILEQIPYCGAIMVFVGILSLIHEEFSSYFWQARRLGGFFQYANTCALFLVIGITILIEQIMQKKKEGIVVRICVLVLLIVGVFLTGSRSVLLLLVIWGIYKSVFVKRLRLPFTIVSLVCIIGAFFYGVIVRDSQNIARIFTIFSSNSTILGRILYYIDGISIAGKHPFGLGYMGYYYMQPAIQTGVYTTRFIHNDFLQLMMDYGVVAFVLAIVYIGCQLIKGKQGLQEKELMVILLLASMVDFHMQYMSMLMILVLCFDLGEKGSIRKRKEQREKNILCVMVIAIYSYFVIACGAFQMKNYDLALELIPGYTEAEVQQMIVCTDKDEAVLLADDILSHNEYISEAYNTKVYAAAMEGNYEQVMIYMERALALRRYDVETYQAYDSLLEKMLNACQEEITRKQIKEYKEGLPQKLADIEELTHPLAFKLRDVPVFKW